MEKENFLEIIVTYHDDREQDFVRFSTHNINYDMSLSNWLLTNLHAIIPPYEYGDVCKFSCWLNCDRAKEKDLFVQDLIQTNGKYFLNQ